jgi:hypothetical protein
MPDYSGSAFNWQSKIGAASQLTADENSDMICGGRGNIPLNK